MDRLKGDTNHHGLAREPSRRWLQVILSDDGRAIHWDCIIPPEHGDEQIGHGRLEWHNSTQNCSPGMQTARVCLNPVMQPNGLAIGSVQNIFNRIMTEWSIRPLSNLRLAMTRSRDQPIGSVKNPNSPSEFQEAIPKDME
ncbi:hypothetical protein [Hyphomonas chukchiensis]|nr:hypothetical protein [Hyphomonas chukchiensis]